LCGDAAELTNAVAATARKRFLAKLRGCAQVKLTNFLGSNGAL
jgi:hypothetical protein